MPLVALIGAGAYLVGRLRDHERERSRVWASWAHARGWGYRHTWPELVHQFRDRPFGRGTNRVADRGFWGRFDGVDVFGFRYGYTVSTGKSSTRIHAVITGLRFPGARFPPLQVTREGPFPLGSDVQFENEAFNRAWRVTSPAPRFAHDVVNPRVMHLLLGPLPPFDRLWFEGDALLVASLGDPDPLHVDAQLRMMTRLAGLLPAFLLREVGGRPVTTDLSGPRVSLVEQQRRMLQWRRRVAPPPAPWGGAPHGRVNR